MTSEIESDDVCWGIGVVSLQDDEELLPRFAETSAETEEEEEGAAIKEDEDGIVIDEEVDEKEDEKDDEPADRDEDDTSRFHIELLDDEKEEADGDEVGDKEDEDEADIEDEGFGMVLVEDRVDEIGEDVSEEVKEEDEEEETEEEELEHELLEELSLELDDNPLGDGDEMDVDCTEEVDETTWVFDVIGEAEG